MRFYLEIKLSDTFADLFGYVRALFTIPEDIPIRLRRQFNGQLITKDLDKKRLQSDEMFIEGGVRLSVEYGESYTSNEILIYVMIPVNDIKVDKKEIIVNPKTTTIIEIKNLFCKEFELKGNENMLHRVNALGQPLKPFKNEESTISSLSFKDCECVYLKNIASSVL